MNTRPFASTRHSAPAGVVSGPMVTDSPWTLLPAILQLGKPAFLTPGSQGTNPSGAGILSSSSPAKCRRGRRLYYTTRPRDEMAGLL